MLVHTIMPESPQENMTKAWSKIRQLYNHFEIAKQNRYGTLRLTMFKVSGGVKLRGKAGEIRAFGPVIHRLWEMYYNSAIGIHRKIELCLRQGSRMEAILNENKDEFALPGECFLCVLYESVVLGVLYCMHIWS